MSEQNDVKYQTKLKKQKSNRTKVKVSNSNSLISSGHTPGNEEEKQKVKRKNFWQQAKHMRLCSDLL